MLELEGVWIITKGIVRLFGIDAAFWLTVILSKQERLKHNNQLNKDGYFSCLQKEIERDTTLSLDKQTKIINQLKMEGVISVKTKGLPRKNYYKVNENILSKKLQNL